MGTIDPFFGKQLNRGKTLVQAKSKGGEPKDVHRLLKSAEASAQIVFATNLPLEELENMGLNESTLRKDLGDLRGKSLIYVSMTACGKRQSAVKTSESKHGEEQTLFDDSDTNNITSYPEGSLGAFFQGGMLSDVLGNGSELHVACPFQFGE